MRTLVAITFFLWVLITPDTTPGKWGWSIIGTAETKEACEDQRITRLDWRWTICAEMKE